MKRKYEVLTQEQFLQREDELSEQLRNLQISSVLDSHLELS